MLVFLSCLWMHTLDDNDNSTETDIYYLPNSDIVLFLTFDTVSRNQKPRKSLNRKNNKIIEWARKANSNRNAAWIQYHNYTCVEKVLLSEWIAAHVVVICLMRNQSKQHQIHTNRRRCFCQSLKVNALCNSVAVYWNWVMIHSIYSASSCIYWFFFRY